MKVKKFTEMIYEVATAKLTLSITLKKNYSSQKIFVYEISENTNSNIRKSDFRFKGKKNEPHTAPQK